MAKNIATIGYEIPGFSSQLIALGSDQSLLDYDVIIFQPDISEFLGWSSSHFQGKPSLSEDASFRLQESSSRWRQALHDAFEHGKTVFIFMSELQEVFVDTGQREHSGTGRNRRTTQIVAPFNNYSMLPLTFIELVSARGKEIKPARDLKLFAPYWAEFGVQSSYEVYFHSKSVSPLLVTRTGNKPVGGIVQDKSVTGKGALVLLPALHYDRAGFIVAKGEKSVWKQEALAFGRRLMATLLEIDKGLTTGQQVTPPPEWTGRPIYRLSTERKLEAEITENTKSIEAFHTHRSELLVKLERERALRRLLFETGPALEDAILEGLRLLGLTAERYKDSESEFDVVFTWNEHRFLGEAEGKDNKPVNIDKMSQLERNLSEDFARDDVKEHAKGILFGNAFRLHNPAERGEFFTDKCVAAAKRIKAALVRTTDLFVAAKYVKESGNATYAQRCVEAIVRAEGTVVQFPTVPTQPEIVDETKTA